MIAPWAITQYWHWLAPLVATTTAALGLGQVAGLVHQGIVIGKECAEFIRAVGEGEEYVGMDFSWTAMMRRMFRHVLQSGTGKRLTAILFS